MINKGKLTNAEKVVMKAVWDGEGTVTCREVIDRLNSKYGHDYADTTVYTFLKNIRRKGYIVSQRKGVNVFEAVKSKEEFIEEEIGEFLDFWLDNDKEKLKAYIDKL